MKRAVSIFLAVVMGLLPVRGAVEFDGADDRIALAGQANEVAGTISAWVKLDTQSSGDFDNILGLGGSAEALAPFFQLVVWNVSGTEYLGVRTRPAASGTTHQVGVPGLGISGGGWRHVALVSDGSAWSVFHDGISQSLTVVSGNNNGIWFGDVTIASGATISIGAIRFSGNDVLFWDGQISEVQIYDRALSAAEIAILASSRTKGPKFSGLVAYWPLDDVADGASGDGATFKDRAGTADGTGNDGANGTGLTGKAETFLSYP